MRRLRNVPVALPTLCCRAKVVDPGVRLMRSHDPAKVDVEPEFTEALLMHSWSAAACVLAPDRAKLTNQLPPMVLTEPVLETDTRTLPLAGTVNVTAHATVSAT